MAILIGDYAMFLITIPSGRKVFIETSELFLWLNSRFTIFPFDHHSLFENITELSVSSESTWFEHTFRRVSEG